LVDLLDQLGFRLVDHQAPINDVVSQWHHAAHPDALALGCRDLVSDSLTRHFALELGEREQHIEGQPPHRSSSVKLLGNGHEGNAVGIEDFDHLGEIGQ